MFLLKVLLNKIMEGGIIMAWVPCPNPSCNGKISLNCQHGNEYKWGKCPKCGKIVKEPIK